MYQIYHFIMSQIPVKSEVSRLLASTWKTSHKPMLAQTNAFLFLEQWMCLSM
jgi:hypothetical protein